MAYKDIEREAELIASILEASLSMPIDGGARAIARADSLLAYYEKPKVEELQRVIDVLIDALKFYADPETYHAIMFVFDPPHGDFGDDFSKVAPALYDRLMPGKTARQALVEASFWLGGLDE